jgi:hypothetical protein
LYQQYDNYVKINLLDEFRKGAYQYNFRELRDQTDYLMAIPGSIDFAPRYLGDPNECSWVYLQNFSPSPITLDGVDITDSFQMDVNVPYDVNLLDAQVLYPMTEICLRIQWQPQTTGLYKGTVQVNCAQGRESHCVKLSGYAIPEESTRIDSGTVSGVWYLEGSPYHIYGDLVVAQGESLVIEPGVDVVFFENSVIYVPANTQLIAEGSDESRIHFFASQSQTGWQGIRLEFSGADDRLCYCDFEDMCADEWTISGGIEFWQSSPKIACWRYRIVSSKIFMDARERFFARTIRA